MYKLGIAFFNFVYIYTQNRRARDN